MSSVGAVATLIELFSLSAHILSQYSRIKQPFTREIPTLNIGIITAQLLFWLENEIVQLL